MRQEMQTWFSNIAVMLLTLSNFDIENGKVPQ